MNQPLWQSILLSNPSTDDVWEMFHENSKNTRYQNALSAQEVIKQSSRFHESLQFDGYPIIKLPTHLPALQCSLDHAITSRTSPLDMSPCMLTIENLATLLRYAYGMTHSPSGTSLGRSFRAVPSAGALYPLEIFFYTDQVNTLMRGLYHYNPSCNQLRLLQKDLHADIIGKGLIQSHLAVRASLILFITAIFERTSFKYGDRGYRYTLLEAGHVAQNLHLVSNALGLGCISIGGFMDRYIDDLLGLDGIRHSTIYMMAVGKSETKG